MGKARTIILNLLHTNWYLFSKLISYLFKGQQKTEDILGDARWSIDQIFARIHVTWMGSSNWNMEKQFSLLIPFTSVCGMLSAKNCTQINPNLINFMLKGNVFEILSTTAFLLSAFIVSLFSPSCSNLNLKRFKLNLSISITSKHWTDSLSGAVMQNFQTTISLLFARTRRLNCLPGSAEGHCKWFVSASLCLWEDKEHKFLDKLIKNDADFKLRKTTFNKKFRRLPFTLWL